MADTTKPSRKTLETALPVSQKSNTPFAAKPKQLNTTLLSSPVGDKKVTTLDTGHVTSQAENVTHTSSGKDIIPTPTRQERFIQFGIDCSEQVHFHHWEPGGEYVRLLEVKNVVMKTQKIRYALPQTRYFSMEFPETRTLSAGMSWVIPITFRPVAKECYYDRIEFQTSFGKFYLPIKATLPEHNLQFSPVLDFENCPLHETARRTLSVKNTGELRTFISWDAPEEVTVRPATAVLDPNQKMDFTFSILPTQAGPVDATVVCVFGDENDPGKTTRRPLDVKIVGKYSFLRIQASQGPSFQFGNVYTGKTAEKTFTLVNDADVHANFSIRHIDTDGDPYFHFHPTSGLVPAKGSLPIKVTYTPVAASLQSTEYFDIATVSGNTIRATCSGSGVGPSVKLSPESVQFGEIEIGGTSTRIIYLENQSNVDVHYQFNLEAKGLFRIDNPAGHIPPRSTTALTVKFTPRESMNYHRRVFCLIENMDALVVDFLGTAYNDKRRPATFNIEHLEKYRRRMKNGLHLYAPEQLEELVRNNILTFHNGDIVVSPKMTRPLELFPFEHTDSRKISEYFQEHDAHESSHHRELIILDENLDFGSCSRLRMSDAQTIRVTNNTRGKITCVWIVPGETTKEDPIFIVSPPQMDISANTTVEFQISFRPKTDNVFYGANLECYAYYKSMRNFRLVSEDTFAPPICRTVYVAGNTFTPGEATFIPKVTVHASRLDFPGCTVGGSEYRTVRISNTGDTPVKFDFGPRNVDDDQVVFEVFPKSGTLSKNESCMIVFRFRPNEAKIFSDTLNCYFNNSPSNTHTLNLRGIGQAPEIQLANGDPSVLVYRPVCLNSVIEKTFDIRNKSRVSVHFEWKIPEFYSKNVHISPIKGVLSPNGKASLTCSFSPNRLQKYVMKLPCYFSGSVIDSFEKAQKETLTVVGTGKEPQLEANSKSFEFNNILVKLTASKTFSIFNAAECDVQCKLSVYRVDQHEKSAEEFVLLDNDLANEVFLPKTEFKIPARSNVTVPVKLNLQHTKVYRFKIFAETFNRNLKGEVLPLTNCLANKYHICDMNATGVFPSLQVVDIRCDDISKSVLWNRFSLHAFNNTLQSHDVGDSVSMDEEDMVSRQPTRVQSADAQRVLTAATSTQFRPISKDKHEASGLSVAFQNDLFEFDFGARSVGSQNTVVSILLKNSGPVPVDWTFDSPNEMEAHVEQWADPGNYTVEQLHQNFILDNQIFQVTPNSGKLEPGDVSHLVFTYRHEFPGPHRFPMILRMKNGVLQMGRHITVYLNGYSIPKDEYYLHFPIGPKNLQPVCMGLTEPPIQTCRLKNYSNIPVQYSVDTNFKEEAGGHPVFLLVSPSKGVIFPGKFGELEFIFKPYEMKTYEFDVPVKINDNETKIITFKCPAKQNTTYGTKKNKQSSIDFENKVPNTQILVSNDQLVVFSKERFHFGNVLINSICRDVFICKNTSKHAVAVSFKTQSKCVSVEPKSIELTPGQSFLCRVIFRTLYEPRVYMEDISCEIVNLDQQAEEKGSENQSLSKFSTLPPINARRRSSATMQKPGPKPKLMHFTVLGTSYLEQDHCRLFKDTQKFLSTPNDVMYDDQPITQTEDTEKKTISDMLSDMLNEIMEEHDVQKTWDNLDNGINTDYVLKMKFGQSHFVRSVKNGNEMKTTAEDELLSSSRFKSVCESIVESTILNILQEYNAEMIELTSQPAYMPVNKK